MYDIFIDILEKQYDLGKYSDKKFKLETWIYYVAKI